MKKRKWLFNDNALNNNFSYIMCVRRRVSVASVTSVAKIILLYCLFQPSNDIIRTLKTPQRLVLKRRNQLTRSKNLLPWSKLLKNDVLKGVLPYPLSGNASSPLASLGEHYSALCTFLGERYLF
jgi:hypothetical protein